MQAVRLIPHYMVAYKQSDTMIKSANGFNQSAFKAWVECWDKYVIPLERDVIDLEAEVTKLRHEINMRGDMDGMLTLMREILAGKSMVLSADQLIRMRELTG